MWRVSFEILDITFLGADFSLESSTGVASRAGRSVETGAGVGEREAQAIVRMINKDREKIIFVFMLPLSRTPANRV
jgi:hypothetical protein